MEKRSEEACSFLEQDRDFSINVVLHLYQFNINSIHYYVEIQPRVNAGQISALNVDWKYESYRFHRIRTLSFLNDLFLELRGLGAGGYRGA